MKEYLIIDIGTSSIRVAAINKKMEIVRVEQLKRTAGVCFDAEKEWNIIRGMIGRITRTNKIYAGAAVSSLLGWIGVDADGNAVTPCYSYMHQCMREYLEFKKEVSDDIVYPISGRCISPELAGFKIEHLKNKEPEIYGRLACFTSLKDYINIKLSGIMAIDHTTACYTMLYDLKTTDWNGWLIDKLGIDRAVLPKLIRPYEKLGTIRKELAREWGLVGEIAVACGSVDGSTGILGAGGIQKDTAVNVMGTTDVFFMVQKKRILDQSKSLVINPHVIPGLWLIGGPMGMYGGTLEWLLGNVMSGAKSIEQMNELAREVSEGSEGVRFYPTLAGERTPFWNSQVRGTILGMEQRHKSQHLFRAIMEANGYAIRKIVETGKENGISVDKVIAIGGGSKSNLWLQIKADILGKNFLRAAVEEATLAGSCMLAMLATGEALEDISLSGSTGEFEFVCEKYEIYNTKYQFYMEEHNKVVNLYY